MSWFRVLSNNIENINMLHFHVKSPIKASYFQIKMIIS